MIVFDADKSKSISMLIETSNIENDGLEFTFIIEVNNIKYGFPCILSENKVNIEVPVLKGIINDLKNGEYNASLQVTGDDKYWLEPFNEKVKIEVKPKMNVILDKDDIKEELELSISSIIEDDTNKKPVKEEKKETVVKTTKSKMSKVFE